VMASPVQPAQPLPQVRSAQNVPTMRLPYQRTALGPKDALPGQDRASAPFTPGKVGGSLSARQAMMCSDGTAAAPLSARGAGSVAGHPSTPLRCTSRDGMPAAAAAGAGVASALGTGLSVNVASLLAGSSLGHLISRVSSLARDQEQESRRKMVEAQETQDLLLQSDKELQQLISVVSQLHGLQRCGETLPDVLSMGPERPQPRPKPPFYWQPSQEYADEFKVSGPCQEVVTMTKDFKDRGWVIPVGGAWRLLRGGVYRWTLRIERKCPTRPQVQLGIHGASHGQPWRLITTSRCSWSRDDEPWQDRCGGDRLIDEGDYVHIEVDMRGEDNKHGKLAMAINSEPYEVFFNDIPLTAPYPLMPVVLMGGNESRVRLCPSY